MLPTSNHFLSYDQALDDFYAARRKAALQAILARLSGKSEELLSYDEVRAKLGGVENAYREIKEIPLDAIVGTVSRYADFSRSLLPLNRSDHDRWARIRLATEEMAGLPPIEVYQIGDAYFILDGHHRASVARELGATSIQAYVRHVRTVVPLSPTDRIEDIILKSEYSDFLNKTHLHELRPDASLEVTVPGEYDTLLEHISVHRYYQGIDEKRAVKYEEAVAHWYDAVYMPVARIIRQRNILKDFPGRTEVDLYLWIMEHRASLESELGWKVDPQVAANDLLQRFKPGIQRFFQRLLLAITPEEIEPSTPPGEWRRLRIKDSKGRGGQSIFRNILVAVPGDPAGWQAVNLALLVAAKENAIVGGLHVTAGDQKTAPPLTEAIKQTFGQRCQQKNIEGSLVVEQGDISRVLLDRSAWADLMVVRMLYPPPFRFFRRLRSGLRALIRLSRVPLLVVPPNQQEDISQAVLAYGGGPRADEALFVATYLASKWGIPLHVVTVDRGRPGDAALVERARSYLESHEVTQVDYTFEKGDPARLILQAAETSRSDLILMGGYERGLLCELMLSSTVDRVLWSTRVPVLICQ